MIFGVCPLVLTDFGYIAGEGARTTAADAASIIRQVAAGLIAIDNANRLVENYKKQRDIQDRMLEISEQQQMHMEQVYWPRDIQFLNEFSVGEAIEAVETMGRRYAGRLVSTVAGAFAPKLKEAMLRAAVLHQRRHQEPARPPDGSQRRHGERPGARAQHRLR